MAVIPAKNGDSCAEPGCGKPVRARGFCVACYYRKLRAGELISGTPTERFRHRLTNINADERTATCAECGPTGITPRDGGKRFRCRTEANARARAYSRAYREAQKDQMADACEICGTKERLRWDHDHKKAEVEYRGTLCNECNTGIGMFRDDLDLLAAAIAYLLRASGGGKCNE